MRVVEDPYSLPTSVCLRQLSSIDVEYVMGPLAPKGSTWV